MVMATTTEEIAKLEEQLKAAQAEVDRLRVALADAQGDVSRARWYRLLADPDAANGERHAAYIRVQAELVARAPHVLDVLPDDERDEIAAEVERLRAAGTEAVQ
jgi:hypothetical protein